MRLPSHLAGITLDDVLTGDTCAPISLSDFEAYLEHSEHSVENLRFIVWYQSYRCRFFALPAAQQRLCPGPREFDFRLPTPARTAQHVSRVSTRTAGMCSEPASPSSPHFPPSPTTTSTTMLSLAPPSRVAASPSNQPFRQECSLVTSTFLLPSAPHQLLIPDLLLSAILHDLASNTHPCVFLPAYEHAYEALLNSLPRFLALNQTNTNIEKTWWWWLQGVVSSLLGWAIVIGCLFISHGPGISEGRLRAWRLLGVPFLILGAMQMYSAYRGYCSEVFGRGHTQLRPWELVAPAPPPTESIHEPSSQSSMSSLREKNAEKGKVVHHVSAVEPTEDYESIALDTSALHATDIDLESGNTPSPRTPRPPPHGMAPIITKAWGFPPSAPASPNPSSYATHTPPASPRTDEKAGLRPGAKSSDAASHFRNTFAVRPPRIGPYVEMTLSTRQRVFGPERVVLDPRIRAVHKGVLRDMLVCGLGAGIVLTTVVLALPSAR